MTPWSGVPSLANRYAVIATIASCSGFHASSLATHRVSAALPRTNTSSGTSTPAFCASRNPNSAYAVRCGYVSDCGHSEK